MNELMISLAIMLVASIEAAILCVVIDSIKAYLRHGYSLSLVNALIAISLMIGILMIAIALIR